MNKLEYRIRKAVGLLLLVFLLQLVVLPAKAQDKLDLNAMTEEQIKQLTYEQLLELDLPDLMLLAEKMGVSPDELLERAFLVKTTTSSKERESLFDSPVSTTVLTSEKILHSGATNLPELFRLVPGMIVREQTPGVYDVHVRGLDNVPPGNFNHFSVNSLTLVMIDGRPVYNFTMGGTLWETLPVSLEDIERIDVVRGASSALYGASAVTGVINIITKKVESVLSASGRVRSYVQWPGHMSYAASSRVSVPLGGGFRLGLRQHAEIRKQVDELAYNNIGGQYLPEDRLPGVSGGSFNDFNEQLIDGADAEDVARNGNRSVDVRGVQGDLSYDGHGVEFEANGGYWASRARSVLMENYITPFSMRMQKGGHAMASLKWKGLSFIGAYQKGVFDAGIGQKHPGVRFDMQDMNFNLEYAFYLWNQLTIRPGFFTQYVVYDDSRWDAELRSKNTYGGAQSLMGGRRNEMLSLALTLRMDWKPLESLRVIAAGRVDKYTIPQTYYPTWQFAVTFKPEEHHLLRAVAARANRSSFLLENSMLVNNMPVAKYGALKGTASIKQLVDMLQKAGMQPDDDEFFLYQELYGSRTLKLLTSDFVELGYRALLGRVSLDLELFGSRTTNFSDLRRVNTVLSYAPSEKDPSKSIPRLKQTMQYRNLPIVVWQGGATLSFSYAPTSNLLLNAIGTWQMTRMDHLQVGTLFTQKFGEEENGVPHTWTPAVNVGLLAEYRLLDKFHFFLETYFRTAQEYSHGLIFGVPEENGTVRIAPYGLCNLTLSYDALANLSVQVGVRNLYITNKKNYDHGFAGREFGFTDRLRPLYQLGLRLSI